jgi:hypothetical protein
MRYITNKLLVYDSKILCHSGTPYPEGGGLCPGEEICSAVEGGIMFVHQLICASDCTGLHTNAWDGKQWLDAKHCCYGMEVTRTDIVSVG